MPVAAVDFLHLRHAARGDADARTDRGAVRPALPHELHRQPVAQTGSVVLVEVDFILRPDLSAVARGTGTDDYVQIAVAIEVGDRETAGAGVVQPPALPHFLEVAVRLLVEQERILIRVIACRNHYVLAPVVVEVTDGSHQPAFVPAGRGVRPGHTVLVGPRAVVG